jgi:CheY-like chemotaxis protein
MLVDDDEGTLAVIRECVLRFHGIQLECFTSPRKALTAFKAARGSFELVITDLRMPGMDGLELGRRLLALMPEAKILLITGSEEISEEVVADAGFCGLLQKPFPFIVLQRALEAIAAGRFCSVSTIAAAI